MSASEKLRALDGVIPGPPWDFDWNAPQNILASDGTGKFVGSIPRAHAGAVIALRNALPLIADLVEAAEGFLLYDGTHDPKRVRSSAEMVTALTALREALNGSAGGGGVT